MSMHAFISLCNLKKIYFVCVCVCLLDFIYTICTQKPHGAQKLSEPLELEVQVVLSHLIWVLGTEPRPSGRAASAANP